MARKLKVYLDTSVISALFDKRNPERQRITQNFFMNQDKFEIYVSRLTLKEISDAHSPRLRKRMQQLVSKYTYLKESEDVEILANEYIRHGAIPKENKSDAEHIAFAVLRKIEYLLSWNFQHILRKRTREIVSAINSLKNLTQIDILTPGEIL